MKKINLYLILTILCNLSFINCKTSQSLITMKSTDNQSIMMSYADGSANLYKIGQDWLEYVPVKPEESSTGFYSGGEPKTVKISPDDFQKIKSLFEKAFADKSQHIADRTKMSGVVSQLIDNQSIKIILSPQSALKTEIESLLKTLLKN